MLDYNILSYKEKCYNFDMKKLFISIFVLLFSTGLFSQTGILNTNNYAEYTLENGMQVFALEDFSSAFVRIEYTVHAGISSQNADNTGFFPLYTRIFKHGNDPYGLLRNMSCECNADSSRYILNVSTSLIEQTMEVLAQHAFAPTFSDEIISKEYSSLKTEVMQYATTPAAFINTAIDSRVFSQAPWKQDSGIYPQLFAKTSAAQIRNTLTKISRSWYTPQNSAIFISGNISKEAALSLAKKTFGSYAPAAKPAVLSGVKAGGNVHKFVMYDPEFSTDLTQIVIQYTSLNMNQSNLAAATYNADFSSVKQNLCNEHLLNIRGPEYINVSAVHKNGSSRLIYQSLLEQNKRSPVEQAEGFIATVSKCPELTNKAEYAAAKRYIGENFLSVTISGNAFMDYLSQFWALDSVTGRTSESSDSPLLASKFMKRPEDVSSINVSELEESLANENPFIFVLVNTKTFNKYKADFKRLGYDEITQKNGSWYTQKLFKNASQEIQQDEENPELAKLENSVEKFLEDSKVNTTTFQLKNNIPVTIKTNRTTSGVTILVAINGGKLADGNRPGFENVMANTLAANIQKEIDKYKLQQLLTGYPEVYSEAAPSFTTISVECSKEDVGLCIQSISDALIFGDITPAEADGQVYSLQTQKRLSNANPVNQMIFRASRYFWDSKVIRNIFDADNDILQKTSYNDMLASYPKLLDANLYSIFITGNTDSEAVRYILDGSLGLLIPQQNNRQKESIPEPDFPTKPRKLSMKIRHLFYTDVKAEDAGPMPAVLVPTKNFEDPVQFWFKSPARDNFDSVLFDAMLFYLKESLESAGTDVKLYSASTEFHCAAISFLSVEHTSSVENIYADTIDELITDLSSEDDSAICSQLANCWILNRMSDTSTNRGYAKLLCNESLKKNSFMDEYNFIIKADKEKFLKVAQEFIPKDPLLKIYSNDAKK